MFNSNLAATNASKEYQIPAQSRIIAARASLLPIRGQADAAVKVLNASSAVTGLTTKKAGGPAGARRGLSPQRRSRRA